MKKIIIIAMLFFIYICFFGCKKTTEENKELSIAAAANLSDTMNILTKKYSSNHKNLQINIIVNSSGKLYNQIINHAPFDIFLSADMNYPMQIYKKGLALDKPVVYIEGILMIYSKKERYLFSGIEKLKDDNIKYISIANPKLAPYGAAAVEAFSNYYGEDYLELPFLKDKFIYARNVSQAIQYVLLETADICLTSKSLLYQDKLSSISIEGKNWIEVNKDLYSPIKQGMVILKNGKNREEVSDFYNYILSDEAKNIFKLRGYDCE